MPHPETARVAAVEIAGLTKRFGHTEALRSLTTNIYPGRLTGLVGPDGAGKTTLMRLMAGLLTPSSGTVRVLGFDTVRNAERISELAGYMPQRFGLYEDLSVMENLDLYAQLRGLESDALKEHFDRLLTFTRLGPFTARLAGRLSGGMKQKLGLACALISSPRLLLLDEPGVGVDPVSRQDLWRMVHAQTAEGVAVVWATAYLDEAERCDTVILLNEGQAEFAGPPGELTATLTQRSLSLSHPKQDRRVVLSRALNLASICDGVIQGSSVRVVLRQGAGRDEIDGLANEVGAEIVPVAPRFEDGFIDLLGGGPGGTSALAESMAPVTLRSDLAVECRELTRRFGDFVAADHVSFQVEKGEIFGLLGPNGAGKSTTFKMLCGLLKPTAGEALVAGLNLRTATSDAKSQLGYMAQKFSLYGLLSVQQNLEFSAGVYGLTGAAKRTRIAEMIEIFHLQGYLKTSPEDLPLGYKQRLALACAVMHQPPVLFLDEPTSGVDPITRREFWTHINGMVRKGVTVLVTTHFMDEAEYCDRVALMYQAKMIALDAPDALKGKAATGGREQPSMEEAFIHLIESVDAAYAAAPPRAVA
ncbi:MAG: ATP-binding cassette domain-containing protein [Methylotetracoccus sp.]|nr:ATP-binding cassette domain-containing protein [Methylotetracoccus sp.]